MRAFRLAYDGTAYFGFQRQPDVPTVEDAVFDALEALDALDGRAGDREDSTGSRPKPPGYSAAGRTDAGVSALAQTVAIDAPAWLTPRALNAELPTDIRAWAFADVDEAFHATHDAAERRYTYHLYAPETTSADATEDQRTASDHAGTVQASADDVAPGRTPVDDERVHVAIAALSGAHDFHNLTPDETGAERTITLDARRDGPFLEVTVTAGGFPRQLVRRLITLIVRVGAGVANRATIDRVLAAESLPGHEGIPPAPPRPLVLADVVYPGVTFERDEQAARRAGAIFTARRIERSTAERVTAQLEAGIDDGRE